MKLRFLKKKKKKIHLQGPSVFLKAEIKSVLIGALVLGLVLLVLLYPNGFEEAG